MHDAVPPARGPGASPKDALEQAVGDRAGSSEQAMRPARGDRWSRLVRWWVRHPALSAAVVYAVLSVAFIGQGLLPGRALSNSDILWTSAPWRASKPPEVRELGANFELADYTDHFQPFREFTRAALPDVPLWNPYIMAGRPYLANAQSAIFSPFNLPAYVLPFWKSLAAIAILKLFVAAFGTYLLGRALGMGFGGALLSGVVFAFGTFFVVWLAWPLTNVFALVPWLLLLTELVVRRPGPLPVAGLAALVALQFAGGHPETSFHAMFATVAYFGFRVLLAWSRSGRERRALIRPSFAFGGALVLGAALAALTLVPLLELLFQSNDWERRLQTDPSHGEPRYLGALLLHDYWGRPTQTPLVAFLQNRGYYAGAIALMLAVAALVLRPTITRLAFAGFGLFTMIMVLGIPPIFGLVTELPGWGTAHNGRMAIFFLLVVSLLAGWGLDELTGRERPPGRRRRLVLGTATAIFCVPIVWMLLAGTISMDKLRVAAEVAWGFSDPPGDATHAVGAAGPIVRMSALLQWLPLAGAGLALIALRLGTVRRRSWRPSVAAFVGLAVAILVVDLFRANMGFNPAIPIEHAEQPTTGSIRYLQSRRPNRFVGLDWEGQAQPIPPNVGMRYELYDARGYDFPVERHFDGFWRDRVGSMFLPSAYIAEPTARAVRALGLLSVSDIMQDPGARPLRLPGLRLAYSGPDARIYRNTRALPRTFLVDRQRIVEGSEAALRATTDPQLDARRVAVTERRVPGVPQDGPEPRGDPGAARLVSYERERVVAAATTRRRSLFVLTDVHYPGWKVRVDGRPATLERVDYLLRGVPLAPGTHRIEFRYEPVSWRVGWITSALALVVLGALAVVGLRAHRRAPAATPGAPLPAPGSR